jgi:hypothetical protein
LELEPDRDEYQYLNGPIEGYLLTVERRVRAGTAYPLLSEATHQGGWIAPEIWVERLDRAQREKVDFLEGDLVRSLLRLAPEGRDLAVHQAAKLQSPLKEIAVAALGGEVRIDGSYKPQVWVTALRARDPWCDVSQHLTPLQRGLIPKEFEDSPDLVFPSDYQWQPKGMSERLHGQGLINAWPTRNGPHDEQTKERRIAELMREMIERGEDPVAVIAKVNELQAAPSDGGFLTVQLHSLRSVPAPSFTYPYLAMQWPMKLDWYWSLATKALSRRVDSGSSVEEPYGRFLLPLLEPGRPLTLMAARALWIATISKDENSRSMAVEAWIELGGSDRADVELLVRALRELEPGGWVKMNRVGEVLGEVSSVSSLHAWVVASVLEAYLAACESFPREVAKLLEPLDECCERLGRAVGPALAGRLDGVTGKAKSSARSLRMRPDTLPEARQEAIKAALRARIALAERTAPAVRPASGVP